MFSWYVGCERSFPVTVNDNTEVPDLCECSQQIVKIPVTTNEETRNSWREIDTYFTLDAAMGKYERIF